MASGQQPPTAAQSPVSLQPKPPTTKRTGLAGVVLIFVVAGMVLATAGVNHVWPASASTNLKL